MTEDRERRQFYAEGMLHEVEVALSGDLYLVYQQNNGRLYLADHTTGAGSVYHHRACIGRGYSGAKPDGFNNPAMESKRGIGPIPKGRWYIGKPRTSSRTGPVCLDLTPDLATETYGRSGFQIHGDNGFRNGTASSGCIVLDKWLRDFIVGGGFRDIFVIE